MSVMKKLLEQTLKTRAILTTMTLTASGWSADIKDEQALAGPMIRLYVWDRPSEWCWMCAVPRDAFLLVARASQAAPANWELYRAAVAIHLFEAARGSAAATFGADWEHQLAAALSAYAGTTQTWKAADELAEGGHFIVCNYRATLLERDGRLRPFVAPGGDSALPADGLLEVIEQVVAIDQKRHPEWFR